MGKGKKAFSEHRGNCDSTSRGTPEDREILAALRAGGREKEKMLYCLYAAYKNVLSSIGRNLNINSADFEEVFNDVFLDLLIAANNPKLEFESLNNWIIGVFKNKAMKKFRKEDVLRKDNISLEDVNPDSNDFRDDASLNSEAIERIMEVMGQLDEECQYMITLRYLHKDGLSLSYEQVARATGKSESVIKRQLPRCEEKIKELLGIKKRSK